MWVRRLHRLAALLTGQVCHCGQMLHFLQLLIDFVVRLDVFFSVTGIEEHLEQRITLDSFVGESIHQEAIQLSRALQVNVLVLALLHLLAFLEAWYEHIRVLHREVAVQVRELVVPARHCRVNLAGDVDVVLEELTAGEEAALGNDLRVTHGCSALLAGKHPLMRLAERLHLNLTRLVTGS